MNIFLGNFNDRSVMAQGTIGPILETVSYLTRLFDIPKLYVAEVCILRVLLVLLFFRGSNIVILCTAVYWLGSDWMWTSGGCLKNVYELSNLRAFKISMLYKTHIFQCMGKIFIVEFQRVPLKFHTKYLTHTLKDVDFIHRWILRALRFKSS